MAKHSIDECIRIATDMVDDVQYKLGRAKDPKNKRQYQNTMDFWQSIIQHLQDKLS